MAGVDDQVSPFDENRERGGRQTLGADEEVPSM